MAAYDKVTFRGRPMDELTKAFLLAMEDKLGYELTVVQGSYSGGKVAQSAGTHDGGGVVDLAAWDYKNKVKVAADLGAFVWYRPYVAGLWGAHIHLGIRDHAKLHSSAKNQQIAWDSKPPRNGLKSNLVLNTKVDYHPGKKITFKMPVEKKPTSNKPNKITKSRDEIVAAIHELGQAHALMASTLRGKKKGTGVNKALAKIEQQRKDLKQILKDMPLR